MNLVEKKHKAIQMYCHFRRYLSPMESISLIKDRIKDCPLDMGQLESARANKMLMAKRNGKLEKYYYTY